MIKIIIFAIIIILVLVAFPVSFEFFNNGFSNITGIIETYGSGFINLFSNFFNTLFNAPTLTTFISIFVCLGIIRLIFNAFIRGNNDD